MFVLFQKNISCYKTIYRPFMYCIILNASIVF